MSLEERRPDALANIELLPRSSHPLILLDTEDEDRAESLMPYLVNRLGR